MKFLFRADGSSEIGLGHLNRCSLAVKALNQLGHDAFLLVKENKIAKDFLAFVPVVYMSEPWPLEKWPEAHACLVDLYNFEDNFYRKLSTRYKALGIYDDYTFKTPDKVTCVININLGAEKNTYPLEILSLTGPEYFPLREEFKERNSVEKTNEILISMGGSDPLGQTLRMARLARKITDRPLCLLLGQGFCQENEIREMEKLGNVKIKENPEKPAQIMARAAYAILGAGSMLYETCYLGIPTACFALSKGQAPAAKAFSEHKAAFFLGEYGSTDDHTLLERLSRFEKQSELRHTISNAAKRLVQGNGAEKTAHKLIKWASGKIK